MRCDFISPLTLTSALYQDQEKFNKLPAQGHNEADLIRHVNCEERMEVRIRFISSSTYPAFHIPAGQRDVEALCLQPGSNPYEMRREMGGTAGEGEILEDRERTHSCLWGIWHVVCNLLLKLPHRFRFLAPMKKQGSIWQWCAGGFWAELEDWHLAFCSYQRGWHRLSWLSWHWLSSWICVHNRISFMNVAYLQ